MQSLTVIQHNVNSWSNKKHELYNIYSKYNADIILINDYGLIDGERTPISELLDDI